MIIRGTTYDILKWAGTIVLPALGTLYFALADIWGLPFGTEVVGTITAVVTFLNVVLKISKTNYENAGEDVQGILMLDQTNPDMVFTQMDLKGDINEIENDSKIVLLVDTEKALDNPSIYNVK